ncbi:MAG: hypothetical protein GXP31_13125 [Kiritimatiellaeota bacterium]|nr:hypothetical protein [Kiritimatiellota bacterium]
MRSGLRALKAAYEAGASLEALDDLANEFGWAVRVNVPSGPAWAEVGRLGVVRRVGRFRWRQVLVVVNRKSVPAWASGGEW